MISKELFSELTANNINFNGNIELTEIGLLWSLSFEVPTLLEDEELFSPEEDLVESFEEDLDYIYDILVEYEEDISIIDTNEFQIIDGFMYVDLIIDDNN